MNKQKREKFDKTGVKIFGALVGVTVVSLLASASGGKSAIEKKDPVTEKLTPALNAARKLLDITSFDYQNYRPSFLGKSIMTESIITGDKEYGFTIVTEGKKLDLSRMLRFDISVADIGSKKPDETVSIYNHGGEIDVSYDFRTKKGDLVHVDSEKDATVADALSSFPDEVYRAIERSHATH